MCIHSFKENFKILNIVFSFLHFRTQLKPAPQRPTDIHEVPDFGVGEGIQVQPISNTSAAYRAVTHVVSHREADQDLVPEPSDEGEERTSGHQGTQRAEPDTRRETSRRKFTVKWK